MEQNDLDRISERSIGRLTEHGARAVVADILSGKLRVLARKEHGGRWALLFGGRVGKAFSNRERAILARTAEGNSGKVVAIDLGIACSTVSSRLGRLLEALGVESRAELATIGTLGPAELGPVAEDGPAWALITQGFARVEIDGGELFLASFTLLDVERMQRLTPAERDVVRAAVAGKTNLEIARARRTSPNTVANQLAQVYRKLKIGSRWALAGCSHPGSFSPLGCEAS